MTPVDKSTENIEIVEATKGSVNIDLPNAETLLSSCLLDSNELERRLHDSKERLLIFRYPEKRELNPNTAPITLDYKYI
ncbi:MAG: hypothetical protein D6748_03900 [Calditrichaeota bacterium]|nr:MAG: hypothetical protein D6748_03900 [Calditrichota bacterium]